MSRIYLVRYGIARAIGRLAASEAFANGQVVVIRTHRGTELGKILIEADAGGDAPRPDATARILRVADANDQERARQAILDAPRRFDACGAIFQEGAWPIDLIDVEALLDDRRTVLLYLGPHQLDASGLIVAFRERCGLDVVLEPAGIDQPEFEAEPRLEDGRTRHGCGSSGCGTGGCGSGKASCVGCPVKATSSGRGHAHTTA